jgi:hypothetical protein
LAIIDPPGWCALPGYPQGMADQTTNGSLSNLSNEFSNHCLSATVPARRGRSSGCCIIRAGAVPAAVTRSA